VIPNFKLLGPKVGAAMKALQQALKVLSETDIKRFLASGELKITADGRTFRLGREDLDVRLTGKEGFAVATDGEYTVALTTAISEQLRQEGFARELVNKIQNMRKEADFNVTDRISVYLHTTAPVTAAADAHADYIKSETLADSVEFDESTEGFTREWDINGEKTTIIIRK
jgi:isoleucyl-tRNA synthetase